MGFGERMKNCAQVHWNGFFFLLSPLIILPLALQEPPDEYRAVFIILWAFLWFVADAAPIAVPPILPIVFAPILGLLDSNKVCMCFSRDTNMVFLLSNFIAVAMEHSNSARHVAYFVLSSFGCSPHKLLVVVMVETFLLATLLPGAFVCALLIPVVRAILQLLEEVNVCKTINEAAVVKDDERPYPSKVSIGFYIGVAYAVNIGSIASSLCGDSCLALRSLIKEQESLTSLDADFHPTYMSLAMPLAIVLLIFTIIYLEIIYLGFQRNDSDAAKQISFDNDASKAALKGLAGNAPTFNTHIMFVMLLYTVAMFSIILCGIYIPKINDKLLRFSVNVMVLCFAYFVLPNSFFFMNYFICKAPKEYKPVPSVLPWGPVNKITPWSSFFVHGSSVAFGVIMESVKLNMFLGDGLLDVENKITQQAGFIAFTMLLTIMGSNTLVADIMLRMGLKAAGENSAPPFLYPITWATNLSFLLPVSSPANSFATGWADLRTFDMIMASIGPTLVGFVLAIAMATLVA